MTESAKYQKVSPGCEAGGDLCRQAEELLVKAQSGTLTKAEVFSETNSLRGAWRDSGNVSMHLAKILWKRFNTACNSACHAFDASAENSEEQIPAIIENGELIIENKYMR